MLGIQMRVHHIQTLAWAGNVILLAGVGWVGWQFWLANKEKAKPVSAEFPDAAGAAEIAPRWPGDIGKFKPIWETPLNGKVPPPPPPPDTTVKARLDPGEEFRKKCELLMAWAHTDPDGSLAVIKLEGKTLDPVRPGGRVTMNVEGKTYSWQLRRVAVAGGTPVATFTCRDWNPPKAKDGSTPPPDISISGPVLPKVPWTTDPKSPFALGGPFDRPVLEHVIEREAYQDPDTGEWIVPDDETAWYETWGEKNVVSRLKTQDTPSGVRILSHPGEGTPVGTGRGIVSDDVVKSINGVEMRSMADVTAYLRGEGRGLRRYEVVIERAGAVRTVVYNVGRRARS